MFLGFIKQFLDYRQESEHFKHFKAWGLVLEVHTELLTFGIHRGLPLKFCYFWFCFGLYLAFEIIILQNIQDVLFFC